MTSYIRYMLVFRQAKRDGKLPTNLVCRNICLGLGLGLGLGPGSWSRFLVLDASLSPLLQVPTYYCTALYCGFTVLVHITPALRLRRLSVSASHAHVRTPRVFSVVPRSI
jgi:hypothetical protein